MSSGDIDCSYACLLLHDDGLPITAEKIRAVLKAANVKVESYWPSLFAKPCEKKDIEDLILNAVSGGANSAVPAPASSSTDGAAAGSASSATEENKEEEAKAEESDEEIDLFDLFA